MRVYPMALAILLLIGCNNKYRSASASDDLLNIQAMKVVEKDSDLVYQVRVFPRKEILDADKTIARKMMYQADSSFYLIHKKLRVYPVSVEYIANGVANSFEYMVRFDQANLPKEQALPLVYQDKYINQKNYQLLLK